MLVQFSFRNILSFKDETTFDMTSVQAYKEHPENVIQGNREHCLKVASIYGANASGKSNICIAMKLFQRIITESFNSVRADEDTILKKAYAPFEFEENKNSSEYQIIGATEDYEYQYGFEYDDNRIIAEWLYIRNFSTNRLTTIFEREETIDFGASVRKYCNKFYNQIPTETLALTFFNKMNLEYNIFKEIYEDIMSTLVLPNFNENVNLIEKMLPYIIDKYKEKFLEFLSAIDTGIKDIDYYNQDDDVVFVTTHIGEDGNKYELTLGEESEGTQKSVILYIFVRFAIRHDKSLFIDEINTKLHPMLLKFIIDLFYEEETKAQLIYTTHDVTLLDSKFFRRDQIWFVDKDEYGCSKLSSLAEYKVRANSSFEKDYLAGVYGGIPSLKNFSMK